MKTKDKETVVDRMMKSLENMSDEEKQRMKQFRKKRYSGTVEKSYKQKLGKFVNNPNNKIKEIDNVS